MAGGHSRRAAQVNAAAPERIRSLGISLGTYLYSTAVVWRVPVALDVDATDGSAHGRQQPVRLHR